MRPGPHRRCCGDQVHIDLSQEAFAQLADTSIGGCSPSQRAAQSLTRMQLRRPTWQSLVNRQAVQTWWSSTWCVPNPAAGVIDLNYREVDCSTEGNPGNGQPVQSSSGTSSSVQEPSNAGSSGQGQSTSSGWGGWASRWGGRWGH
jgi:hypothetical protein